MKKIYFVLVLIGFGWVTQAQNIEFTDAVFKDVLVNQSCCRTVDEDDTVPNHPADINGDGEIDQNEAVMIRRLFVSNTNDLTSAQEIFHFSSLEEFGYNGENADNPTSLQELDLSQNTALKLIGLSFGSLETLILGNHPDLEQLAVNDNFLNEINVSECPSLRLFWPYDNNLTQIDVSNNIQLEILNAENNNIESIDLSLNPNLIDLDLDNNQLTEIDLSLNTNLTNLYLSNNQLLEIDIQNNVMLENVYLSRNGISTIDVSQNPVLRDLNLIDNEFSVLDLSQNPEILGLRLSRNNFETIPDISANTLLFLIQIGYNPILEFNLLENNTIRTLSFGDNQFSTLDLTGLSSLEQLVVFGSSPELEYINLKNQSSLDALVFGNNSDLVSLNVVCADESEEAILQQSLNDQGLSQVIITTDNCELYLDGDFSINGTVKLVETDDICDAESEVFSYQKLELGSENGNITLFADENGHYDFNLNSGQFTLTPVFENTNYFNASPNEVAFGFPDDDDPFTQDFCVTSTQVVNDVEISVFSLESPRPGFVTDYRIVYKNKGTTPVTNGGSITLGFEHDILQLTSSSQTVQSNENGVITYNYDSLGLDETRIINFSMYLNSPMDNPPVDSNEILEFIVEINTTDFEDEMPGDNRLTLYQQVVNSFDPNDITCLQGEVINPEMAGEFVHYRIRFENTGTADAIRVVVQDEIDTSVYDLTSLTVLDASHSLNTHIEENLVSFRFENINLPFDDANNDGFILFKIKTLSNLESGDFFENTAGIYFDFNNPIITNTARTTVDENLGINSFTNSLSFKLFPNPATNIVNIEGPSAILNAQIFSVNGRLISETTSNRLDISHLESGIYFVSIISENGTYTSKLIKK